MKTFTEIENLIQMACHLQTIVDGLSERSLSSDAALSYYAVCVERLVDTQIKLCSFPVGWVDAVRIVIILRD